MNPTATCILVGLLAGAGGAFAVRLGLGQPARPAASSALSAEAGGDLRARLERIEALLERRPFGAEPALRGAASAEPTDEGATSADLDGLLARIEARLEPIVRRGVEAGMTEAFAKGAEADGAKVEISTKRAKKRVTLAQAAAELELTREEEDAVRRIAAETTEAFFELLADKDKSAEDIRREFEDAQHDPNKKLELTVTYTSKALGNFPALISLGVNYERKMKEAVGPEKARKIERDYRLTDLDPYGIEDMFQFD